MVCTSVRAAKCGLIPETNTSVHPAHVSYILLRERESEGKK